MASSRRAFVRGLAVSAASLTLASLVGRPAAAGATSVPPRPAHPSLPAAPPADDILNPAARAPGELSPLITANAAFYVVTKNAAGDPQIDASSWRLAIDGWVNSPVALDYNLLQQLPAVELVKTLECITNFTAKCELASFGCGLISTGVWTGARLSDVFDLADGLKPGAVSVAAIAADEFSSALPVEAALDPDTLLVYAMNGAPLTAAHGFPARVLVPGRYGMKNAKWVVQLTAMTQQHLDWYGQRGWNRQGFVKTMSRIDSPAPQSLLPAGPQRIAGIAYAGDRGIAAVEFSADGGVSWQTAGFLEPQPGRDSWVRWQGSFNLAPGQVAELVCRATDGTGVLQTEQFSLPPPDGATGWHSILVKGA